MHQPPNSIINEALQELTGECCEAYVDDIIIWGNDAKDLYDNISMKDLFHVGLTVLKQSSWISQTQWQNFLN
ncbi:hypothetical protein C352_05970 [Cryptococcus neoformans CHC193]|nr:hypothetical protein C352_05972 [Cryptococcus neoformans var. grubii CHC193]OXG52735.1 hypothetical protein C352_05970 [Cryptococcus neoformans var. grubii CHC193]